MNVSQSPLGSRVPVVSTGAPRSPTPDGASTTPVLASAAAGPNRPCPNSDTFSSEANRLHDLGRTALREKRFDAARDACRQLNNLIFLFADGHNRCGQPMSTGAKFAAEKWFRALTRLQRDIERANGNSRDANAIALLAERLPPLGASVGGSIASVLMAALNALAALVGWRRAF